MLLRAATFVLALAAAGCGIPEAKKAEAPPVHPDLAPVALKLVHIPGPRVKADDTKTQRRLEEAVGVASGILGLDAIVLGGDAIANDVKERALESIDAFASLAGIVAAKRYVVLGERERAGALGREDVVRALDSKKLLPDRSGTYADAPRHGVRLLVLDVAPDGSVKPEARSAFEKAVKAAKEKTLIVAADQPPLDKPVQDLLRKDRRVKAILFRAAISSVTEEPNGLEPILIATATLDEEQAPAIRAIEIDGPKIHIRLLAAPDGTVKSEQTFNLR